MPSSPRATPHPARQTARRRFDGPPSTVLLGGDTRRAQCSTAPLAVKWVELPAGKGAHPPYEAADLAATTAALSALESRTVTGTELAAVPVDEARVLHPVLRRRDVLGLFDTAADLSGNDIDVSPFIRDTTERTVSVAWRAAEAMAGDVAAVARGELCPAPIASVRELVGGGRQSWIFDQADGRWRAARQSDVRPSAIVVLDAAAGGYRPEIGFSASDRTPVDAVDAGAAAPDAVDIDPQSTDAARWVSLGEHLADTELEARRLLDALGDTPGLTPAQREAVVRAAALHDLGKAHESFQAALVKANPDHPPPDTVTVWAKSPGRAPLRPEPPHLRHELVSALLLAERGDGLLDGVTEADLVIYLALAHHGKVRVSVRARPDEPGDVLLGVREGSATLAADVPRHRVPAAPVSLAATRLGPDSLTGRALRLRDRSDLGPFRLGFAEALVRSADWRASATPGVAGWVS